MGQELTQVPCPECGTAVESDPGLSRCQCSNCGKGFFLRRCSACARVSYVDGLQGFRTPWPCTWCGRFTKGFSPNQDPAAATAAELAAEIARPDPARRGAPPEAPGRPDPAPAAPVHPVHAGWAPPDPPRSGRRRARRVTLLAVTAVACVVVASIVLAGGGPSAADLVGGDGATRPVQTAVAGVAAIDFQGVPGRLAIDGTQSGQVILTGQLHGTRGVPEIETRLDRATGILAVSVRCVPGSPCTEDLRLAVPAGVGTTLRQSGGRVVVTGLTGPLCITAANTDVTASGLHSPTLMAVITRGHLNAAFTAVPRQASITLTSAQATLRLPTRAAYRLAQQVTAGHIRIAVPLAPSSPSAVTTRIQSGELDLLPS